MTGFEWHFDNWPRGDGDELQKMGYPKPRWSEPPPAFQIEGRKLEIERMAIYSSPEREGRFFIEFIGDWKAIEYGQREMEAELVNHFFLKILDGFSTYPRKTGGDWINGRFELGFKVRKGQTFCGCAIEIAKALFSSMKGGDPSYRTLKTFEILQITRIWRGNAWVDLKFLIKENLDFFK